MGLRFRNRFKIMPGVTINLNKKSGSVTLGPRGANLNIGPTGKHVNIGGFGTGFSWREKVGNGVDTTYNNIGNGIGSIIGSILYFMLVIIIITGCFAMLSGCAGSPMRLAIDESTQSDKSFLSLSWKHFNEQLVVASTDTVPRNSGTTRSVKYNSRSAYSGAKNCSVAGHYRKNGTYVKQYKRKCR